MKRILSILCYVCVLSISQAAIIWEYANLNDFDSMLTSGVRWSSPKGNVLEGRNVKELGKEMKKANELSPTAKAENVSQLIQDLGNEGWELMQVEKKGEGLHRSDTYYFKRQKSK